MVVEQAGQHAAANESTGSALSLSLVLMETKWRTLGTRSLDKVPTTRVHLTRARSVIVT